MRDDNFIPLGKNDLLMVKGENGILGISKAGDLNKVFVQYSAEEKEIQLDSEDVIVAFGFGIDEKIIKGIECVLFLIRELGIPLIAFPKNRTLSTPIRILISLGKQVKLTRGISPAIGFNPNLLCATGEFDGMEISSAEGGITVKGVDLARFQLQYSNISRS